MAHHNDDLAGYAVLGFGLGLYIFYKGFRQYRNYLLIADTPEIAIRSIPVGFAQISGKRLAKARLPDGPWRRGPFGGLHGNIASQARLAVTGL